MAKNVLLLVGSPRVKMSTSEALGDYLLARLQQKGCQVQKIKINQGIKGDSGLKEMLSAIDDCDTLILASPLYVDSAPATVIKAMELIDEHRSGRSRLRQQTMLAICNCGFPEARHNNTALAIFRCFAQTTGFHWAGGLALGGGEAIGGKPLQQLGGMVRNVTASLDLVADAIAVGEAVPEKAFDLISKPLAPTWLYKIMAGLGWRSQAKSYGAHAKLNERPYQQ